MTLILFLFQNIHLNIFIYEKIQPRAYARQNKKTFSTPIRTKKHLNIDIISLTIPFLRKENQHDLSTLNEKEKHVIL